MDIRLTAEDEEFRTEVREFLRNNLTDELRTAGRNCSGIYCEYPEAHAWHRILYARGWSTPAWPIEWGGTG